MVVEAKKRRIEGVALSLALLVLLVSGCVGSSQEPGPDVQPIVEKCIQLCREYQGDKSSGPCLSNNVSNDWVCDIAHWPRQAVDNNPENQCPAYGRTAHHFVEVDEDCNLIRYV